MRRYALLVAGAVASFTLVTSASAQMVQDPSVTLETHRAGSVEYISGGIGEQERAAMRSIGNDYNLKVATATPSGHMLNNVDLTVATPDGTPILNVTTQGPLFYAKLPEGRYNVIAKVEGRTFQAPVRVGGGAAPELALSIPVTASAGAPAYSAAPSVSAGARASTYAAAPSAMPPAASSRTYASAGSGSRDPKPIPDETHRHISLYDIDPSAANVQAQVTLYEVYPDGTTRVVTPGSVRAPADADATVTIQIEPVPAPGAALPPPAIVVSPDGQL